MHPFDGNLYYLMQSLQSTTYRTNARPAVSVISHLAGFIVMLGLVLFSASNPVAASQAASPWVDEDNVSVRLISATRTAGADERSNPLLFGLEFQLAENWKVYWRSPGDAGYPPTSQWLGSENVSEAQMLWPAPHRFSVLGFETLGYKNEVVLPIAVTPKHYGEPVKLAGEVDFLACAEICIPMLVNLSLELPGGPAAPSAFAHLINKYSVQIPGDGTGHGLSLKNLSVIPATQNTNQKSNAVLIITATSMASIPFVAPDVLLEGPLGVAFSKPKVQLSQDGLTATLSVETYNATSANLIPGEAEYTATLMDGQRSAERTLIVNAAPQGTLSPFAATETPDSDYTLLGILAIAFLGGLILNLMPCVLPVLSIKLLGVINHGGGDVKAIRYSFLASAAGIISSFMIIAIALAALKSSGAVIGWGIQFQQPVFLIAMAILITVFACNMLGWLNFNFSGAISDAAAKASGNGPRESRLTHHFTTGMLATLLATPCSAPFLGTAVGFALSRGTEEIMMIFAVLGIGLSTPYLIVAAAPRLASSLPKPGQWMITLRKFLGLALAGTAIWLLSVLYVQVGWPATSASGVAITGIAGLLFLAHRFVGLAGKIRIPGAVILAVLALSAPLLSNSPAPALAKPADQLWQPFDMPGITRHITQGHIVFVDVTADWCITCQVNKAFVLEDDDIYQRLSAPGVIAMQADWTLPNEDISRYLARFQRFGIPFNAIYGPGAPHGLILPELLSKDAIVEALNTAKG